MMSQAAQTHLVGRVFETPVYIIIFVFWEGAGNFVNGNIVFVCYRGSDVTIYDVRSTKFPYRKLPSTPIFWIQSYEFLNLALFSSRRNYLSDGSPGNIRLKKYLKIS
jgi:hypothetical protein